MESASELIETFFLFLTFVFIASFFYTMYKFKSSIKYNK
jgi:hypothetical protein